MTIILLCNVCETAKINLSEAKVYDYKKLYELTGWEMHSGQKHVCPGCLKVITKYNNVKDEGESERIMFGHDTLKEDVPRKEVPKIEIIEDTEITRKTKTRIRQCRYCEYYEPYGDTTPKMNDNAKKIRFHEQRKHPELFTKRRRGQRVAEKYIYK
jgi:hypothetical protein